MLLAALERSDAGHRGPGGLFFLLFMFLIGFLIVKLIARKRGPGPGGPGGRHRLVTPLGTLEDRFARGEIDQAEFTHRKAVLTEADVIPPAPAAPSAAAAPPPPPPAESSIEPDPTPAEEDE